jgi:hypothetical protein
MGRPPDSCPVSLSFKRSAFSPWVTADGVFFKYQNGSGTVGAGGCRRTARRSRLPQTITIATRANPTTTIAHHKKIAERNSTLRTGGSGFRFPPGPFVSTVFASGAAATPVVGGSAAEAAKLQGPANSSVKKTQAAHPGSIGRTDGCIEWRMENRRQLLVLWPAHKSS